VQEMTDFSVEELEIVELPQREALGKGGKNHVNANGNKGGLIGALVLFVDIL